MKRRLPTTDQGETVLAAISLPPVTAEANRHASHPAPPRQAGGRGERGADRGQREPARPAGGVTAAPPSSTASAANPPPAPGRAAGTGGPSRGRSYTAPPPVPPPGGPRTPAGHLREHRADGLGHIQPPGQRERRSSACSPAGAHRSRGTKIFRHRPLHGHNAGTPTRTPAPRHTTGSPAEGNPPHARPPRTHRPQAGTAIRWTGDTASDPFSRWHPNQARRDHYVSNRCTTILTRAGGPPQPASPKNAAGTQPNKLSQSGRQHLPDPVDIDRLAAWMMQHGLSRDEIVSRMGGSPESGGSPRAFRAWP